MSTYTIQNSFVSVTIDEHAAEIHSFFDRETSIEAMWQGDKTYWAGRNPILFPMVGKLGMVFYIFKVKSTVLETMALLEIVNLNVSSIQILKSLWNFVIVKKH